MVVRMAFGPQTHDSLAEIGRALAASSHAIVFTGAGISTGSGLPDYRGANGLWRNKRFEQLANLDMFVREPAEFWEFYGERLAGLRGAHPNAAHEALGALEQAGIVRRVITQNVDGLHHAAGSDAVELHGTLRQAHCLECGERFPIAEAEARRDRDPEQVPRCNCGFPLKPAVVLFGELLPVDELAAANAETAVCDFVLCLGSSLQVSPARNIPVIAQANGAQVAVINRGETTFDEYADFRVEADLVEALPVIAQAALAARNL